VAAIFAWIAWLGFKYGVTFTRFGTLVPSKDRPILFWTGQVTWPLVAAIGLFAGIGRLLNVLSP
jgi:hypothetical protein